MENKHISDNILESYFAMARDMKPVLSVEEVESQITKARLKPAKSFINNFKFKLAMTSLIIITATYISSLFFPKETKLDNHVNLVPEKRTTIEKTTGTKNQKARILNSHKTASNFTTKTAAMAKTVPANEEKVQGNNILSYLQESSLLKKLKAVHSDKNNFVNLVKFESVIQESNVAVSPCKTTSVDSTLPTPSKISDNKAKFHTLKFSLNETPSVSTNFSGNRLQNQLSHPDLKTTSFLTLDKKHLAKMGFNTQSPGIDYRAKIEGIGTMYCYYHGAESKFGLNDTTSRHTKNTYTFYPVYISDKHGHSPDDGGADPVDVDYISGNSQFEGAVNQHPKEDTVPISIKFADHGYNLIPVLFKSVDFGGFPLHKDIVFWFKKTPELDSILSDVPKSDIPIVKVTPDDIAQKQIDALIGNQYFTLHSADDNKIDPAALQGIKFLELDREHLEKLGFKFSPEEISYHGSVPGNILRYSDNRKNVGLFIKGRGIFQRKNYDFYPVFISDRNGIQNFKYRNNLFENKDKWTDAYFLATIRKLVPIVVKQNIPGLAEQNDVVFWFNVTPSFLKLLPDTIAQEMGQEYKKLLNSNSETPDTTTITTCKYFDVCQLPLEFFFKVNIYPNPAQLLLNIDFDLPANITGNLCMTDLSGKIVKTMGQTYSGIQHISIMTENFKSGIYLVILRLNSGMVITNKVVINGKN